MIFNCQCNYNFHTKDSYFILLFYTVPKKPIKDLDNTKHLLMVFGLLYLPVAFFFLVFPGQPNCCPVPSGGELCFCILLAPELFLTCLCLFLCLFLPCGCISGDLTSVCFELGEEILGSHENIRNHVLEAQMQRKVNISSSVVRKDGFGLFLSRAIFGQLNF